MRFGGRNMDMLTDSTIRVPADRPDETGGGSHGAEPRDKGARVAGLMQGKRGLIMGVANDHSIAWGIAKVAERARRLARLHLSGRSPRQARRASRQVPRLRSRRALRRRGPRLRGRGLRGHRQALGRARLRRPRRRLLGQERAQGPLCRHHAAEFLEDDADLLLLLHGGGEAGGRSGCATGARW